MRNERWVLGGLVLAGLMMTGAALALAQPIASPSESAASPADSAAAVQERRSSAGVSESAQERRQATALAQVVSAVTVSVNGGSVTATTSDPDVELTVSKRGQLLKIADAKTGQQVTVNTQEFSVQQGEGANSLRIAGDSLTFHRGAASLVEIRRTRSVAAIRPPAVPRSIGVVNQPTTPPRHLVSGSVSADGRQVVTSHFDRTLRIWDAATAQEKRVLAPYHERVRDVLFAAEGREIAIVSEQELRFVDVATGRAVRTLGGNIATMHLASISADGRRILTASAGAAHVWNVAAGRVERGLPQHMDVVNSVAISSNGRRGLCVGGYVSNSDTPLAELARVWDLDSGKVLFELKPSVRTAMHGALSVDGTLVAAPDLTQGKRLALWDVDTGRQVRVFDSTLWPQQILFSSDGRRLACQGIDGTLIVLETDSGRQVATFHETHTGPRFLGWSRDGNSLLGSDGNVIRRWQLPPSSSSPVESPMPPTSDELRRIILEHNPSSVAFTPDGKQALTSGMDNNLRLWDLQTGKEVKRFTGDQPYHMHRQLAIAPDGRHALLGGGISRGSERLSLWNLDTWREVRVFEEVDSSLKCIAFSADGRLAAGGSIEGDVRVWEVESGRLVSHYQPGVRDARSVCFAPDGKLAVYAGGHADSRLRLWDVTTGNEVRLLTGHRGPAVRAAFLPDGRSLVSAGDDSSIRLWDVESGNEIRRMQERSLIRSLAVAGDGRRVVVGTLDGTVSVWDLQTGRQLVRYAQHTGRVESLAATADGERILSNGNDRTIRIWPLPPIPPDETVERPKGTDSVPKTSVPKTSSPKASASKASTSEDSANRATAPAENASPPPGAESDAAGALEKRGARLQRDRAGLIFSANIRGRLQTEDWNNLARLPNLRLLALEMPLRDADLPQLKRLTGLQSLSISASDISDAGLGAISNLTGLQNLSLTETRITDEGLAAIRTLSELRDLFIYGSQITDEGLAHLQSLERLRQLSLYDSAVTGTGLAHLHKLPELYHVTLAESPVTDEGLQQIAKLPKLMMLQLRMCQKITDDGLRHLGAMSQLRSLQIDGTSITDQGLVNLQGLLGLQALGIGHTKITEAGLQHLDPLLNLRTLWLNELDLSAGAIERLRSKLPHLKRIDGLAKPATK